MKSAFLKILVAVTLTTACAHKSETSGTGSPATGSPPNSTAAAKPAPYVPQLPKERAIQPRGLDYGATIKSVAFGSSANQDLPQPIWSTIET
ncbi:MAG: hypothetical protein EOP06_13315, partial [Proteobacteria bacterium]